ncbi:hypothetical protein MMC06_000017 [Schaereria dolodes]|nr:hypothetical protein [Schaereria dolodes]
MPQSIQFQPESDYYELVLKQDGGRSGQMTEAEYRADSPDLNFEDYFDLEAYGCPPDETTATCKQMYVPQIPWRADQRSVGQCDAMYRRQQLRLTPEVMPTAPPPLLVAVPIQQSNARLYQPLRLSPDDIGTVVVPPPQPDDHRKLQGSRGLQEGLVLEAGVQPTQPPAMLQFSGIDRRQRASLGKRARQQTLRDEASLQRYLESRSRIP